MTVNKIVIDSEKIIIENKINLIIIFNRCIYTTTYRLLDKNQWNVKILFKKWKGNNCKFKRLCFEKLKQNKKKIIS